MQRNAFHDRSRETVHDMFEVFGTMCEILRRTIIHALINIITLLDDFTRELVLQMFVVIASMCMYCFVRVYMTAFLLLDWILCLTQERIGAYFRFYIPSLYCSARVYQRVCGNLVLACWVLILDCASLISACFSLLVSFVCSPEAECRHEPSQEVVPVNTSRAHVRRCSRRIAGLHPQE